MSFYVYLFFFSIKVAHAPAAMMGTRPAKDTVVLQPLCVSEVSVSVDVKFTATLG